MASLRKHPRSPYWYLRTRNLDTHDWEEQSTGLRYDDPSDTRKAQRLAEKASIEERRVGGPHTSAAFQAWVPEYMEQHWQRAGDSRRRYGTAWQAVKAFLVERALVHPRQIRYEHGRAYIAWRILTPVNGRIVGHNTALLELKFLSQLMNEAKRRGFTESNPLERLGIARTAQKIKPELTDKQIKTLRTALKKEPDWMRTAFEISLYTGCRFSECQIPMSDINLSANTDSPSRLEAWRQRSSETDEQRSQVGVNRDGEIRLKKVRAPLTCDLSLDRSRDKNSRVNYLFRRLKIPASFHSLRVTFVTRCHRGGLSETEAMRLVNHSSKLVHQIYSRLNVEDVRKAQAKIPLP